MKRIFKGADTTPLVHTVVALALLLVGADRSESLALTWEVIATHGVGDGDSALSAPIGSPRAIAIDAQGRLYIADSRHARIRVVEDGAISTLAGTGATGYNGDGIPAATARINYPTGVTVGADGTVYFIDQQNHRIRSVASDGIIRTVAGDGRGGFGGDGGPATAARLSGATGIAIDPGGNLYIADTNNHRLRKITPEGLISTIAGTGEPGRGGDGGPAVAAILRYPELIALDGQGALYFYDSGHRVVHRIGPEGTISATPIEGLVDGLAADAEGTVYYSQYGSVWRLHGGQVEMLIGRRSGESGQSAPREKAVAQPDSLTVDAEGNLFVADLGRLVVVKADGAGGVERVAGNGTAARYGDGGPANGASFACGDLVVGEDGTIFFTDISNDRVAMVRPDGRIETFGGDAAPDMCGPAGLALAPDGDIYVADFGHNRVLRLDAGGGATVVAGTRQQGFSGDGGPATAAELDGPGGVALDDEGRLYIGDTRNKRIRRVDTDGSISTIAGNGERGDPPDGALATGSPLGRPGGLVVARDGEVLVAVTPAKVVRRITLAGTVYTHQPGIAVAPILDVAARLGKELPLRTATATHFVRPDVVVTGALSADLAAPPDSGRLGRVAFDPHGDWVYACDPENRRILRARLGSADQ